MQNDASMRERLFTMRMSEEESERLDVVAQHYGLNGAGVIRMLLKREADAIKNEPPGDKPKKGSRRPAK